MSVLIKGMEMPKDGAYWCEIGVAGEIATITIYGKDRKAFPLIQIPTDVVPVVHGHWYVYETGYEDTEAKCSICGFETLVNEPGNGLHMVGDLQYCPHCGASMDEVTE